MTNREKSRNEWTVRVADYKASGLAMSAWYAANHCTMDQLISGRCKMFIYEFSCLVDW